MENPQPPATSPKALPSSTALRSKPAPTSPGTRKLDLLYTLFFAIHLPIMFLIDLYPLYPPSLRPPLTTALRRWYVASYHDQFFTAPPAWFTGYLWLEAGYHIPLCVWAARALWRDPSETPLLPVHLLIYATQTAVTTLTCILALLSWDVSPAVKLNLGALYGPYLLLSVVMGVDMFARLRGRLLRG